MDDLKTFADAALTIALGACAWIIKGLHSDVKTTQKGTEMLAEKHHDLAVEMAVVKARQVDSDQRLERFQVEIKENQKDIKENLIRIYEKLDSKADKGGL